MCSIFVRFGRRILLRVLSGNFNALIKIPTYDEIQSYKAATKAKYSLLDDTFSVEDDVKICLEQCGDVVIHNMSFNRWQHDHFVRNVLVFGPSGVVISRDLDAPGAMHDSCIA